MTRIVVFGNSGSGKSTLTRRIAPDSGVLHLDLKTVAWGTNNPASAFPSRKATPCFVPPYSPIKHGSQRDATAR